MSEIADSDSKIAALEVELAEVRAALAQEQLLRQAIERNWADYQRHTRLAQCALDTIGALSRKLPAVCDPDAATGCADDQLAPVIPEYLRNLSPGGIREMIDKYVSLLVEDERRNKPPITHAEDAPKGVMGIEVTGSSTAEPGTLGRWEVGLRNIATIMVGARSSFEITGVVEACRAMKADLAAADERADRAEATRVALACNKTLGDRDQLARFIQRFGGNVKFRLLTLSYLGANGGDFLDALRKAKADE
jgi:hypothetical protein